MEALKIRGVAHNGFLTVKVPEEFEDQELEVIVLPMQKNEQKATNAHAEKVKRLMSIVGTAKFPDTSLDILNVYEQ